MINSSLTRRSSEASSKCRRSPLNSTLYRMKVLGVRLAQSHVGVFIGILYAYGVFLGVIGFAWNWLWDRGVPQLRWWQYLLVPFAIGAVVFALEGVGTFCAGGFTVGHTESKARLVGGKAAIVVLLVALLLGWPMYRIANP